MLSSSLISSSCQCWRLSAQIPLLHRSCECCSKLKGWRPKRAAARCEGETACFFDAQTTAKLMPDCGSFINRAQPLVPKFEEIKEPEVKNDEGEANTQPSGIAGSADPLAETKIAMAEVNKDGLAEVHKLSA